MFVDGKQQAEKTAKPVVPVLLQNDQVKRPEAGRPEAPAKSDDFIKEIQKLHTEGTYERPVQEQMIQQEMAETFGNMDPAQRKDQMIVLSHTVTPEDYQKMQEDGFPLNETSTGEIVTEMDKIKLAMAKAGKDISVFADGLSLEEIKQILGNTGIAMEVAAQMQKQDLPATRENLEEIEGALSQAENLREVSRYEAKYMIDNELPPTIEQLYRVEYSGSTSGMYQSMELTMTEPLKEQVKGIIEEAGYELTNDIWKDAKWMLENHVPLTTDTLTYMEDLTRMKMPIGEQKLAKAIVRALADGRSAVEADLIGQKQDLKLQAAEYLEIVQKATEDQLRELIEQDQQIDLRNLKQIQTKEAAQQDGTDRIFTEDGVKERIAVMEDITTANEREIALVTARRQLEEIRLTMSWEANYTLLKRGIQIDTEPIEELIKELRNVEDEYYGKLLAQNETDVSEDKVKTFKESMTTIEQLKTMPAYTIGRSKLFAIGEASQETLQGLKEQGLAMRNKMEQAGERYETLMTAPRKDLGDSIQKAFQNVDAILDDLQLDHSNSNERAVRILGYNEIEINSENIVRMKEADQQVQMTFKNLTPAVVLQMIRKGMNPLDMDIRELNEKAMEIREDLGYTREEKFSEYLYQLEQNKEISQQERDAYIGVYRLISQVEKTDGAVVGALVNQGADVTMRNLMMAVRTKKHGAMDYHIDDSFENAEGELKSSITQQIESGYQKECLTDVLDQMSPKKWKDLTELPNWEDMNIEQVKEYLLQQEEEGDAQELVFLQKMQQLQEAARAPQEVYQLLDRYDISNTVWNVLGAQQMLTRRNVFRQIFEELPESEELDMEALKAAAMEDLAEAVKTPKEMARAQQELAETAENVMNTMIMSSDVSSVDINKMKLAATQLQIAARMAREEHYSIPVLVGDELTNVSLKIVRGEKEKGKVDIMFETSALGKVAAEVSAAGEVCQAYIAAQNRETAKILQDNRYQICGAIAGNVEDIEEVGFQIIISQELDLNTFVGEKKLYPEEQTEEERRIQTSTLYGIAERFIKALKKIDAGERAA